MNSMTLRLLAVTGILAFEAAIIILNIQELNLVAGAALIGAIGALGAYRFLAGSALKKREESRSTIQAVPLVVDPSGTVLEVSPTATLPAGMGTEKKESADQGLRPGIFHAMGKGLGLLVSSLRHPLKKTGSPNPARETAGTGTEKKESADQGLRPGIFHAMGKGLGLLVSSVRHPPKETGSPNPVRETAGTGTPVQETAGINPDATVPLQPTLSSMEFDMVSPVGVKREPSPFSPLEQKRDLNADLILSRTGSERETASGVIHSDGDLDSTRIFAPGDEISHMDLSLQNENPLTIDEEQDDEVSQILGAYQDELPRLQDGEVEISLDQKFEGLDDIDLGDLVPDGETKEPQPNPANPGPPVFTGGRQGQAGDTGKAGSSNSPPRKATEEPSFQRPASGEEDLISSLRTDITTKKHQANLSLLRELKDVRVQIGDIEHDINEFLAQSKKFR